MKNLGNLMKQAQEMQAKMQEMQDRLADIEISGASGAGMVRRYTERQDRNARYQDRPVAVQQEDAEVVEDLIMAAFNDAKAKAEKHMQEQMAEVTGGLNLPPGMKLPF